MERYDRQMRIEGWDQSKLEDKHVVFIDDNHSSRFFNSILCPLLIGSASLGIENVTVYKPGVKSDHVNLYKETGGILGRWRKKKEKYQLSEFIKELNPFIDYHYIETYFVNMGQSETLLKGAEVVVDLSNSSISKKICVDWLSKNNKNGILLNPSNDKIKMFTYQKGRENVLLGQVLDTESSLPKPEKIDPVVSTTGAFLVLEELKNILMGNPLSNDVVEYSMDRNGNKTEDCSGLNVLVVGCGALGNPVGTMLALKKMGYITFMDHDVVEESNLNRQPMYWDAIGQQKAVKLANRVEEISELTTKTNAVCEAFTDKTKIDEFDLVYDCVDNFKAREIISKICQKYQIPLVSGGTSFNAGNVTVYKPKRSKPPHEVIGYENLIKAREEEQQRNPSCIAAPNPSVIMSNWIIGPIMVNESMKVLFPDNYGEPITNGIIAYDAQSSTRLRTIKMG